jgi:hypothetical protein
MQSSLVDASGKDDLSDLGNQEIGDINIDIDSKAKAAPEEKSPEKMDTAEKKQEQSVEEMK